MAKEKRKIRRSSLPISLLPKASTAMASQPEKSLSSKSSQLIYSAKWELSLQLIFLFFGIWFFGIRYADFLYVSQFSDLFCFDLVRFWDRFGCLGGGLYALTSLMVQFFYYPLLGGIILTLLLGGIQGATAIFYRLEGWWYLLSFVPPLCMMIAITSTNYCIFDLLAIHKIYSFFPGVLLALLMGVVYVHHRSMKQRLFLLFGLLLLLFPLCGFYALWGGAFCLMGEFQHHERVKKQPPSENSPSNQTNQSGNLKLTLEIIFLLILGIPILWYPLFCRHLGFAAIYYEGLLPSASLLEDYVKAMMTYWFLLGGLYLFFILLTFYQRTKVTSLNKGSAWRLARHEWYGILVLLLMMGGTTLAACHTDSFMRTLQMYRALEKGDWDKLLTIKQAGKRNNRAIIGVGNLALFEKGEMGEHLFETDQTGVVVRSLIRVSTYRVFGDRLLYRSGLVNFSSRITMNKFVSRPESALVHRMFVRIAAVNGNSVLAERFIPALESSLFHANWVRPWRNWFRQQEGLSESDLLRKYPDFSLEGVQQVNDEVELIRSRCPSDNYFTEVVLPEFSVLEISQHEGFEQMTPEMQELYLIAALLSRHKSIFMRHIDQYIETRGERPLQKHFQEALLLFRFQAEGVVGDPYYSWSPEIIEQLHSFLNVHTKILKNREDAQLQEEAKKFGHTFWKYYIDDPNVYY